MIRHLDDATIARNNDAIVTANVERVLRAVERPATEYVIRRALDGLYFVCEGHGRVGIVWGSLRQARRFEFMTIAWGTVLFAIEEPVELFDVVPVKG